MFYMDLFLQLPLLGSYSVPSIVSDSLYCPQYVPLQSPSDSMWTTPWKQMEVIMVVHLLIVGITMYLWFVVLCADLLLPQHFT